MRIPIALLAMALLTGAAVAQTESPVAKTFDAGPAMQGNGETTSPMPANHAHAKRMARRPMTKIHAMHKAHTQD